MRVLLAIRQLPCTFHNINNHRDFQPDHEPNYFSHEYANIKSKYNCNVN